MLRVNACVYVIAVSRVFRAAYYNTLSYSFCLQSLYRTQTRLTDTHAHTRTHTHTRTPHAPTHDTLHLERIICPASVSGSTVFGRKRPAAKIGRSRPFLSYAPASLETRSHLCVMYTCLVTCLYTPTPTQPHTLGLKNHTLFHTHKQVAQICAQSKGCDRIFLERIGLR